jgi:hypothetical protein
MAFKIEVRPITWAGAWQAIVVAVGLVAIGAALMAAGHSYTLQVMGYCFLILSLVVFLVTMVLLRARDRRENAPATSVPERGSVDYLVNEPRQVREFETALQPIYKSRLEVIQILARLYPLYLAEMQSETPDYRRAQEIARDLAADVDAQLTKIEQRLPEVSKLADEAAKAFVGMARHSRRYPNDRNPQIVAFRENAPSFLEVWNREKAQTVGLQGHFLSLPDDVGELKAVRARGVAIVGKLIALPDGLREALGSGATQTTNRPPNAVQSTQAPPPNITLRERTPPEAATPTRESIDQDLDRLIKEGEKFTDEARTMSALPPMDRQFQELFWSFRFIEWRDRSFRYLRDNTTPDAAARFSECSPPAATTLTIDQLRCHVDRLREARLR